jgi:ammonia channel protein AmtB
MPTTSNTPTEQNSRFWRLLPTVLLMKLFRQVDKQESPALTHTVAHVLGSLLFIVVLAIIALFWKHIPAVLSFLFGSNSMLWQPMQLQVWILLLVLLWPFVFVVIVYVVISRKLKRLEAEQMELNEKVDTLDPQKQKWRNFLSEIRQRRQ